MSLDTMFAAKPALRLRFRPVSLYISLVLLAVLALLATFGPLILPDPAKLNVTKTFIPPGGEFLLGTDELGRDVLSRVATGLRYSILTALLGTLVGAAVGITCGLLSGFFGGLVDRILMRIVDIQIVMPQLLLVLLVVVVLRPGLVTIVIALALSCWYVFARVARAQVLSLRDQDMISGMIAVGMTRTRLLLFHVLPNISGPLIALATLEVAHLILAEASLGFLGLGLPPPLPTLGRMVAEGKTVLLIGKWWPALMPGLVISLLIFSVSQIGDWLQRHLDPRQRLKGSIGV